MNNSRRLIPLALVSAFALAAPLAAWPTASFAQIGVSITVAPPVLPVYSQPVIPGDGYIWQPGYWAWADGGYYWVPGTWVLPPSVGLLWTPGYWGWDDGSYRWHAGYWGRHVGFYGGIDYGYGYTGDGYAGGRWDNGHFMYNRTVNNFGGTHITNAYSEPVHNFSHTRVSFNGGTGGIRAQPTAADRAAANEHHVDPTAVQMQHEHAAAGNHALFASVNHGRPPVAATARPTAFTGHGVVAATNRPERGAAFERSAQAGAALNRPEPGAHGTAPEHAPEAARPGLERSAQAGSAARPAPEIHGAPQQHRAEPAAAGTAHPMPSLREAPHHAQPAAAGMAHPAPHAAPHPHAAPAHAAPMQHRPQPVAARPAAPHPAAAPHAAPAAHPAPSGGGEKKDEHH